MAPKIKYTQKQMKQAINAVQDGASVNMASKLYNVPKTLLQHKVNWRKMIRHSYLTRTEENDVVRWINLHCQRGLPPHRDDVLTSAQDVIAKVQRRNPFQANRPGGNWFKDFMKRNPDVTVRTEDESKVQVTKETIREWFIDLKIEMTAIGALDIFQEPSRVFSTNEKNLELCPTTGRAIGVKEWKTAFKAGTALEILALTFLGTFNARGDIACPGLIYPCTKILYEMSNIFPDKWFHGQSDNGLMTTENFYEYLQNGFIPWLKANNIKKPVILFIDGCRIFTSLRIFELCEENGVILYLFPPDAAHILQPNIVGPFKHFKDYWIAAVREFQNGSQNAEVHCKYVSPLLYNILHSKIIKSSIINGFLETGLCPFDENKPDYSKCITMKSKLPLKDSSVTGYKNISKLNRKIALNVVETILGREIIEELQKRPNEVDPVLRNLWNSLNNGQDSVSAVEKDAKRLFLSPRDAMFLNDKKLKSAKVVCTRLEEMRIAELVKVLKGDHPIKERKNCPAEEKDPQIVLEDGNKALSQQFCAEVKREASEKFLEIWKNCSHLEDMRIAELAKMLKGDHPIKEHKNYPAEGKDPQMALEDENKALSHKVYAKEKPEASEEYSPLGEENLENCSRVCVKKENIFIKEEEPDIFAELSDEDWTEMFVGFEPCEQLCNNLDSTSHLPQSVEDIDCYEEVKLEEFTDSDLSCGENIYRITTFKRSQNSNSMHHKVEHDHKYANPGSDLLLTSNESVFRDELSEMDLNGATGLSPKFSTINTQKDHLTRKRYRRRATTLERNRSYEIRGMLRYLHNVVENRPQMEMKLPPTLSVLRNAEELITELETRNEELTEVELALHRKRTELVNKISNFYQTSEEEIGSLNSWIVNQWSDPDGRMKSKRRRKRSISTELEKSMISTENPKVVSTAPLNSTQPDDKHEEFRCIYCPFSSKYQRDYQQHSRKYIEDNSLNCSFSSKESRFEKGEDSFKCSVCFYRTSNYEDFNTHLELKGHVTRTNNYASSKITSSELTCERGVCVANNNRTISLDEHINNNNNTHSSGHKENRAIKCNKCSFTSQRYSDLEEHMKIPHIFV